MPVRVGVGWQGQMGAEEKADRLLKKLTNVLHSYGNNVFPSFVVVR